MRRRARPESALELLPPQRCGTPVGARRGGVVGRAAPAPARAQGRAQRRPAQSLAALGAARASLAAARAGAAAARLSEAAGGLMGRFERAAALCLAAAEAQAARAAAAERALEAAREALLSSETERESLLAGRGANSVAALVEADAERYATPPPGARAGVGAGARASAATTQLIQRSLSPSPTTLPTLGRRGRPSPGRRGVRVSLNARAVAPSPCAEEGARRRARAGGVVRASDEWEWPVAALLGSGRLGAKAEEASPASVLLRPSPPPSRSPSPAPVPSPQAAPRAVAMPAGGHGRKLYGSSRGAAPRGPRAPLAPLAQQHNIPAR